MPSPIGHLLAGSAVALLSTRLGGERTLERQRLAGVLVCALLAALPDVDLLYQPLHRTVTHSLVSIPVVTSIVILVTGWVTGRRALLWGIVCGVAWGSHIPLDWLGADPNPPQGIQALWPFSDRWFISGVDLFSGTERRHVFTRAALLINLRTVIQEVAILGPMVAALWWTRTRR